MPRRQQRGDRWQARRKAIRSITAISRRGALRTIGVCWLHSVITIGKGSQSVSAKAQTLYRQRLGIAEHPITETHEELTRLFFSHPICPSQPQGFLDF